MMTTAEDFRRQAIIARDAVEKLGERRVQLERELGQVVAQGASADFVSFAQGGAIVADRRTASMIEADISHLDAMVEAGNNQAASYDSRADLADQEARRAWVAGMTMADAVAFAKQALGGIDLDAITAELDRIERAINRLDEPRIAARGACEEAFNRHANLLRRYQGRPDPKSGQTVDEAAALCAETLAEVNRLRGRVVALQRSHERCREDLKGVVSQAFTHVSRLSSVAANNLSKHAETVAAFARSTSNGRPMVSLLQAPDTSLPSSEDLSELSKMVEPALALCRRAPPPMRPDIDYAPRAVGR